MSSNLVMQAAVGLLAVTSVMLLISRDWRYSLAALGCQYIGVALLVSMQWPVGMALIKLVVGWMTGATLGFTQFSVKDRGEETSWPRGWVFRLGAAALVMLVVFSVVPQMSTWLTTVSPPQVEGGLLLLAMGLLQLGMTAKPFRVILGLLTFLSGFEIIYSAVEVSILVAGLLAAVNLSLALVGTYLIAYSSAEKSP